MATIPLDGSSSPPFLGPVVPFVTAALTQTLSDGGSPLGLYVPMAILTILIVAPIQPFVHRSTYHVHFFLLLAFAGTLVYNLTAFPFSANNRLKLYFVQEVDLDTGVNTVMLRGADPDYLQTVAQNLPSTAGLSPNLTDTGSAGRFELRWPGLAPTLIESLHPELPPELAYNDWLHLKTSRSKHGNQTAKITLSGANTRNCRLYFDTPVTSIYVEGSGDKKHNAPYRPVMEGSTELRLWRRDWTDRSWVVHVEWKDTPGLDGRAVCMWNQDESKPDGGIPALQEFMRYAPTWAAVSKNGDGLVEGSKRFMI